MFIILLKFSDKKGQASEFMEGHNRWLKAGFDDAVFLAAGSLQTGIGGGILAHNTSLSALQTRVNRDPFVEQGIVLAEVLEFTPVKTEARLDFLRR